jgi:peptidoglycan/xylan/chitin deacetylase (PgdA/CDA1 family)
VNAFQTQLAAALAARQGRQLRLFFRDDDVAEDEARLRQLLQLFQRWETPVSLAVIPGRLTRAGTALLKATRRATPGLLELQQHGWQHLNHEATGKQCEFGPSRSYAEQRADLAAGQARLNEAFGTDWAPLFVPPWNRCTAATAAALADLGFVGLSRDAGAPPLPGSALVEVPVTLDLYRWRGGAALRPWPELAADFARQLAERDTLGVLLHHQVMEADAFAMLDVLLQTFRQAPGVARVQMQSML